MPATSSGYTFGKAIQHKTHKTLKLNEIRLMTDPNKTDNDVLQSIKQKDSIGRNFNTILLFLSGGIDSTFLLYHLLKNTNYTIHTHHISLKTWTNRWKNERSSVDNIVEYCKRNIRYFEHTDSIIEYTHSKTLTYDINTCCYMATNIIPSMSGEIVVTFGIEPDMFFSVDDGFFSRTKRKTHELYWAGCWNSLRPEVQKRVSKYLFYPLFDYNLYKRDFINILPKELLDMTWSCRTPDNGRKCGQCHSCKVLKLINKFDK